MQGPAPRIAAGNADVKCADLYSVCCIACKILPLSTALSLRAKAWLHPLLLYSSYHSLLPCIAVDETELAARLQCASQCFWTFCQASIEMTQTAMTLLQPLQPSSWTTLTILIRPASIWRYPSPHRDLHRDISKSLNRTRGSCSYWSAGSVLCVYWICLSKYLIHLPLTAARISRDDTTTATYYPSTAWTQSHWNVERSSKYPPTFTPHTMGAYSELTGRRTSKKRS